MIMDSKRFGNCGTDKPSKVRPFSLETGGLVFFVELSVGFLLIFCAMSYYSLTAR